MIEPRSTATIRALASLAELSANQLEEGVSVEEVIATLRKAAEAVRTVVDEEDEPVSEEDAAELAQDLTPMDLSVENKGSNKDAESDGQTVLNAG
ncbi:hypothetical protein [Roseibium aggregatum]|uniref:Uncharacterized protein n=1 Tax=Roseibium aggregatum TaxID=187304 RepID=A0A939J606_9HYPH|nr:hypothetical protein [Roseibium aggregatum]MBN9673212.1 hypothetical protein [Roseibium aggregatum]